MHSIDRRYIVLVTSDVSVMHMGFCIFCRRVLVTFKLLKHISRPIRIVFMLEPDNGTVRKLFNKEKIYIYKKQYSDEVDKKKLDE